MVCARGFSAEPSGLVSDGCAVMNCVLTPTTTSPSPPCPPAQCPAGYLVRYTDSDPQQDRLQQQSDNYDYLEQFSSFDPSSYDQQQQQQQQNNFEQQSNDFGQQQQVKSIFNYLNNSLIN